MSLGTDVLLNGIRYAGYVLAEGRLKPEHRRRINPVCVDGLLPVRRSLTGEVFVLGSSVVEMRRGARWRSPALALLLAAPLIVERVALLTRRTPTAADETLYLIQSYDWLGRLTKVSYDPHRTRGVPALLYPLVAATDGTWVYRSLFVAMSLALCWVTYLIGRDLLGHVAGAFAAVMLGLFSTTLLGSLSLLPDMPAALGIAIAFLVYWRRVVRVPDGEELRGLWPIGLGIASAFFFNIAFAAVAGIALGLDFLLFRRRDLLHRATLGAAVSLGAVLAPYFVKVWIDHGNPLYTIRRGLGGGGSAVPKEKGYVTYAKWFFEGDRLFGPFWGALIVAGLGFLLFALIKGRPIPRRHASLLAIWLVVPTILTAALFHAEERYLMPWLPAFFLALSLPVCVALRAAFDRRLVTLGIAGVLVAGATQFGVTQYRPAATRLDRRTSDYRLIHAAAQRMADEGIRIRCQIFTRWPREFELHTGCKTLRYNDKSEDDVLTASAETPDPTYYVWWQGLVGNRAYQPPYLTEMYVRYATPLFTMRGSGKYGPVSVYRYKR
jgi:4-amino-4-deoxy-L-arabinose transferase-like glycosyltransferase